MDYNAAMAFLDPDDLYLLSTHVNADGDGVGALLALGELLNHLERRYRIVISDKTLDEKFAFLPGCDRIESYESLEDHRPVARAIFVDTPTIARERVGDVALLLGKQTRTLIIDHHEGEAEEGDVRLIDTRASAASELVYRFIQASGVAVSAEMATQVFTGIAFDTKLFKYSRPKRALKVCAELVDLGADPERIAGALFAQQTYETVKTLGLALSSLALHLEGRISTLSIDHETYALGGDLDAVVDYAMGVKGVEVALFFKEEAPGCHRVSLRSRGDVDVNQAARAFGGGGHQKASGCVIEASLDEARRAVLAEIERRMKAAPGTSQEGEK